MKEDSKTQSMDLQEWLMKELESGKITDQELYRIQTQLFELIGQIAATLYGSRNEFTPEEAQRLMESTAYQIMYEIRELEEEEKLKCIREDSLQTIYDLGKKKLEAEADTYHKIALNLKEHHLALQNHAYIDTAEKGILEFFDHYDQTKKAHEIPGEFDYPLCREVKHTGGLLYVKEYLENFMWEEQFCHLFDEKNLCDLLNGFSPEAEQMPVNLYELVLANVMGNLLMEESVDRIKIFAMDDRKREQLRDQMNAAGLIEMSGKIRELVEAFLEQNKVDQGCRQYVISTLEKMIQRYQQSAWNQTLDSFFVIPEARETHDTVKHTDCARMEQEELGRLKTKLTDCSGSFEKLSLIRQKVKNMDDLAELLDECIFGEEAREVFLMLTEEQLAQLMMIALNSGGQKEHSDWENSIGWHMELMLAIHEMSMEKQAAINQIAGKMIAERE